MIVLAVDPGSRWTAMIVRDTRAQPNSDAAVIGSKILDRDDLGHDPATDAQTLRRWALHCADHAQILADGYSPQISAVEAAIAPTPYGGGGRKPRITNPGPIIDAAVIVGAIVAQLDAIIVPPEGFGAPVPNRRVLEAMYPPSLIGPRETTGSGKSPRQHLRAAFDLALAAASPINRAIR